MKCDDCKEQVQLPGLGMFQAWLNDTGIGQLFGNAPAIHQFLTTPLNEKSSGQGIAKTTHNKLNGDICPVCKGAGCSLDSTEQDHYPCPSCGWTGKRSPV